MDFQSATNLLSKAENATSRPRHAAARRQTVFKQLLQTLDVDAGTCRVTTGHNEAAVWKQALNSGLICDIPVADEAGGQVLPAGYHVQEIREERCAPDPGWKLPDEIS